MDTLSVENLDEDLRLRLLCVSQLTGQAVSAQMAEALDRAEGNPYAYLRSKGLDPEVALSRLSQTSRLPALPSDGEVWPTQQLSNWLTGCRDRYAFRAGDNAWLPLTTIGSVPVLGHYTAAATDFGGFHPSLCSRVLITFETYQRYKAACLALLRSGSGTTPMPALPECKSTTEVFHWQIEAGLVPDSGRFHGLSDEELESRLAAYPELLFGLEVLVQKANALPLWTMAIEPEAVKSIPESVAEKFGLLCYYRHKNYYHVAMPNPALARKVEEDLNARMPDPTSPPKRVLASFAPAFVVREAAGQLQTKRNLFQGMSMAGNGGPRSELAFNIDPTLLSTMANFTGKEDAEVILSGLLTQAVAMSASDIHLEENNERMVVRYRLDGRLKTMGQMDLETLNRVVAVIKNKAKLNIAEKRLPQDGSITVGVLGRKIRVRIATSPSFTSSEYAVLRILDTDNGIKNWDQLHLHAVEKNLVQDCVSRDHGLILVTGPTGSGKTSTLYTFLQELTTEENKVITIEDPVEIALPGAQQMQVNTDIGRTFARLLRSVLRQDPDVIMLGEIRDAETAGQALQASLTGHMVFSTLHTNDALRSVARMEELKVEPARLADALLLLQAQRLIRLLCPVCKQPEFWSCPEEHERRRRFVLQHKPTADTRYASDIRRYYTEYEARERTYQPGKCRQCNNTGYSGRRAVMELCQVDGDMNLREKISARAPYAALFAAARERGMRTLYEAALNHYLVGETSYAEASQLLSVVSGLDS